MIKMHTLFNLILTLTIITFALALIPCERGNDEWEIHGACNHRSRFTSQELEDAKIYLQTRYRNGASIKPQKPACKSLKVIRDFRCLSERERQRYVKALVNVYRNTDYISNVSYIHTYYWPFVNIMAQANAWHNKIQETIQKEVEKFDPKLLMAYWDVTPDATAPEKALVWDYFGHAGNQHNDYCVPDGPFSGLKMKYPSNSCLKREWNRDGTINRWESPEVITFILQQGIGSITNWGPLVFAEHFKKHVYLGGLHGDMGNVQASNEPIFYLFHWYALLIHGFQWQLEADSALVDLGWNPFGRVEPPYSYSGTVVTADIEHDTLLGFTPQFNATTVAEALTFGFGDFCYIPDRVIEAILSVVYKRRPRYPPAVQRLRDALPSDVFAEFFPKFADNTATELNYHLPNTGNTNCYCKPIPVPLNYTETEAGRQQFERFHQTEIGLDFRELILYGEAKIYNFIKTLNAYNYCSPYVA